LRRNFENSPDLYVPEVYFDLCRRNVMVQERIHGIPVNDIEALRKHGVNLKKLSDRGSHIFFTQVFSHNFFHADMHPGNIFVSYENPEDPKYVGVDFGIMGTLSPFDQRYLAENLYAFLNRDYRRVAELHLESGWVPSDTRVDQFESAIRMVCEPIFQRPLSEISFGHLLLRLFQTARRFNMEVQPQLVLLQKTLLNIEGLGRQLDPDLDLWVTAKPFLDRWMSEQVGVRALVEGMRKQLPRIAERLPEMPDLIYSSMKKFEQGQAKLELHSLELEEIRKEIKKSNRNLIYVFLFTGAVILLGLWYF
ncbi:MAG: AarF/UbiB family protein, partial [Gammaproteobacteria bacterium]